MNVHLKMFKTTAKKYIFDPTKNINRTRLPYLLLIDLSSNGQTQQKCATSARAAWKDYPRQHFIIFSSPWYHKQKIFFGFSGCTCYSFTIIDIFASDSVSNLNHSSFVSNKIDLVLKRVNFEYVFKSKCYCKTQPSADM